MSHKHGEYLVCPNCGFHAKGNFCAQCGQETHLHKETFWGLVMHFAGHYFHYDSKFWQTLKALWFSPGKLTIAYWNKQRMRYIPPISLYIFISAVYFLVSFTFGQNTHYSSKNETNSGNIKLFATSDSSNVSDSAQTSGNLAIRNYMLKKSKKITTEYGSLERFAKEKIGLIWPKIFFFMIPFMALLLKMFFARRKDVFFLHHSIFSLHYHSLWFSLFFITTLLPEITIVAWLNACLAAIAFVYMVAALRNVYGITKRRAVFYTISIGSIYFFMFAIVFSLYFLSSVMLT